MKAPAGLEKVNWTRLRWAVAVVMLTAVHLILILWFSDWAPLSARESVHPHEVILRDAQELETFAAQLGDPTLFALPTGRGFAGQGQRFWQRTQPPERRLGDDAGWLELETSQLGSRFLDSTVLRKPQPMSATRQSPAQPVLPTVPALPQPSASQFLLDPNLTARELLGLVPLPSVSHSNVLADTVLRIAVAPNGFVFSAVVLQSSGWSQADALGLATARSLRFRRQTNADPDQKGEGMTWGRLTCRWLTVPEGGKGQNPG